MKLGVISYTNRTSGVGAFAWDIVQNFPVDSYLSVKTIKGQEQWLKRQIDGLPNSETLARYLAQYRPDVVLMVETAFDANVFAQCRAAGTTTVLVTMHESYAAGRTDADWYICPTRICYDKIDVPNKVYFDWPIDVTPFPFKVRRRARRFLHVMGYGAAYNRRQSRAVYDGFCALPNSDITLTIHCQQDPSIEYGKCEEPRVTFRLHEFATPAEVYAGFDVLVQPDSYAGYNRVIMEAKSCGLPTLTTDAPPMNELVTDRDALIAVDHVDYLDTRAQHHSYALNMERHIVTPDAVAEAIGRTLTWDVAAKSRRARKCAETHSWTEERKADFWRLLEECHNR